MAAIRGESERTEQSHWIPLATRPDGDCSGFAVLLNKTEFMVGIGDQQIFKFDSIQNEWTLVLELPTPLRLPGNSMAVDSNSNRLYLSGPQSTMLIFDLLSGSIIHQSPGYIPGTVSMTLGMALGMDDASLVNVNGAIHRIGGNGISGHSVWNDSLRVWHHFGSGGNIRGFSGSAIYVPSKRIILAIGAQSVRNVFDTNVGVWRHHINSGKWHKMKSIKTDIDFSGCGCVLTSDEKYVVIMGCDRLEQRDCIGILHILDGDRYELRKSALNIPGPPLTGLYLHRYALTEDTLKCKLLTAGWIRRVFASKGCSCPSDIKGMIGNYYSMEMFHWIANKSEIPEQGSNHMMISLDDVMSFVT